jgi:hypothetical protein
MRQTFQIKGICPIILHNGRMANPLDPWAKKLKEISSKRSKTDADHEQMAKIEWHASLYLDKEGRLILPAMMIEAALVNGSKKFKLGQQAKAGLFVDSHAVLEFDGQGLSDAQLWDRGENTFTTGCVIGGKSRVQRTRFRADDWAAKVAVTFDDGLFNPAQVKDIFAVTGSQVGVGTWRPRHGRFLSEALGKPEVLKMAA